MGVFCDFIKVTYLNELIRSKLHIYVNVNYLAYHLFKSIAIIKTFNVSKHEKSRVNFSKFKTCVYFK